VAANGLDLEVTFDLAADGVSATTYDVVQRAYVNNGGTRTDLRADATLTNNGGGNYTITVAGAAPEFANNNRWLFRVQDDDQRETRTYFYADFPDNPFAADVSPVQVDAGACQACHGPEGIDEHGGAFIMSEGGEVCLTCHGSDESDDPDVVPTLANVAHRYHSSLTTNRDGEINGVTYPTYMNNCSVCHRTDDQLAVVNAMPIATEGCLSCHGTVADIPFSEVWAPIHASFDETTDCEGCHVAGGIAPAIVAVTDVHNGAETARHGFIWDGVDTSITEGDLFDWEITDVVDDGVNLAISWQASYDGVGVDPCNDTVGAGAPVFFAGEGELSMYRSYAQGEDFIIGMSTSAPGQPSSEDLTVDNTACVAGVATTTLAVDVVDAEFGRLALGGKPLVVSVVDPLLAMEARVPTPTYDWRVGIGGRAPDRRPVVDTEQCLKCHVGSLYQHGGDRVDNVDMCLVCHNSASNEKNRRVAMGVDASEAYDGKTGETFEMKTMLHRIHSAKRENQPVYTVYRSRGIYAFAPDVSDVPNWDVVSTEGCTDDEIARGERLVFGGDPESTSSCQPHNFHSATYPRSLNECTACHTADITSLPDQTKAMATTVEAGGAVWENQLDDVLQGAGATACITCHADSATKGHAYQNSWDPQEFAEGRQTIIDAP
jgi:OmcA/MtrC family decaheme c-type cytochrome